MPVTTRAKNRLQVVELQLVSDPSDTIRQPSNTTGHPSKSTKSSVVKEPSILVQSFSRSAHPTSNDATPSQAYNKQKSRQPLAKTPLPDNPSTVETFWPCQKCSCQEGIFEGLVDNCVKCGHTMDDHEPDGNYPWTAGCDYLCTREELVASVLQQTRTYGVMIIRATPMVGKTALLRLLGHHVVHKQPDLEPVYFNWKKIYARENQHYEQYLQCERARWQKKNAKLRPRNPNARTIYLIDEAQDSYEDSDFWSMLKNCHNTENQHLFVLVCVYGAAGVCSKRDPSIESQAQRIHALQGIELRPTTSSGLCMLFRQDEVASIVQKFALYNKCQLGERVATYLYSATGGHPGMIGLLLSHIVDLSKSVSLVHTRA
jgi:hypothetical protein